jgi:hypothetical protein
MWTCPLCPLCQNLTTTPTATLHNNNNEYRAFSPCCIQCSTNTNIHIRCNSRCGSRCSRPCNSQCNNLCNSQCSSLCNTLRITFRISNRLSTLLLPGLGFLSDVSCSFRLISLSRSLRVSSELPLWKSHHFLTNTPIGNHRCRHLPRPGRLFFFTTYRPEAD